MSNKIRIEAHEFRNESSRKPRVALESRLAPSTPAWKSHVPFNALSQRRKKEGKRLSFVYTRAHSALHPPATVINQAGRFVRRGFNRRFFGATPWKEGCLKEWWNRRSEKSQTSAAARLYIYSLTEELSITGGALEKRSNLLFLSAHLTVDSRECSIFLPGCCVKMWNLLRFFLFFFLPFNSFNNVLVFATNYKAREMFN